MSSTVSLPSEMMPTPLAMALAVIGWSPVTMMTCNKKWENLLTAAAKQTSLGVLYTQARKINVKDDSAWKIKRKGT